MTINNRKVTITQVISGGQTGADRAALDFAIEHNIPYDGRVPKGRLAEDGPIPETYQLQEMPTGDYSKRTEQNVLDSEGTLIVSHGMLAGGSAVTKYLASLNHKPCLHTDLDTLSIEEAAFLIKFWTNYHDMRVLNVAGPRASKDPEIYQATLKLLEAAFEASTITTA